MSNADLVRKETIMSITDVLNTFLASDDFASGVLASTKAGFGGSSYSVEIFEDGTWRVLWANEIGNLYKSAGEILSIPQLSDSDYQDFCDMAGEDGEDEDILSLLRNTDQLEELAKYMRDTYSDGLAMGKARRKSRRLEKQGETVPHKISFRFADHEA